MDKKEILQAQVDSLLPGGEVIVKYVQENFSVKVLYGDYFIRLIYLTPRYDRDLEAGTLEPDAILTTVRNNNPAHPLHLSIRQGFDTKANRNHIFLNADGVTLLRAELEEYIKEIKEAEKIMHVVELIFDLYFPDTLSKKWD